MVSYRQYFTDELGYKIVPRISSAIEEHPSNEIPLRVGVSLGGPESIQWSVGFGVHVAHYHLDVGFSQIGEFINHSKGFALGMENSLWF